MAELSEAEKNDVSHRARAVKGLIPILERMLREELARTERIVG